MLYFTAVELIVYAVSASEHRSRRGVVTLTYTDRFGERLRSPSIRGIRRPTSPRSVLGNHHGQKPGSYYKEGGDRSGLVWGHREADV